MSGFEKRSYLCILIDSIKISRRKVSELISVREQLEMEIQQIETLIQTRNGRKQQN